MASAAPIGKPTTVKRLPKLKAWSALKLHYRKIGERHLRDLFEDDPERAEKFTVEAVGISFDYS
jgi:glucose-6-phosphate isomerase